jgi:hypothetical protein
MGYCFLDAYGHASTNARDYWSDLRDRVRSTLDPGETHNYLMVSDIVRWVRSGNYVIYHFLVKAMNGGVPTGPVWLFSCGTGEQGANHNDFSWYWYTGTNGIYNYYENFENDYLYQYSDAEFAVYYHPTAGKGLISFTGTSTGEPGVGAQVRDNLISPTKLGVIEEVQNGGDTWIIKMTNGEGFLASDPMYADGFTLSGQSEDYNHCFDFGFTDHDNGLMGGTFGAPTHQDYNALSYTPYSDLARFQRFMPWPYSQAPDGLCWDTNMTSGYPQWVAIYDSEQPSLSIYASWGRNPCMYQIVISGEIITPLDPTDPYKSGFCRWRIDPGDVLSPGDVLRFRCHGMYASGSKTTFSRYRYNFFGYGNSPRYSDLQWPWQPVPLANSSQFKGYFDTNLIRNIGKTGDDIGRTFQGPLGPFIKFADYLAFPWVNGEPVFPPFRWDKAYPWWD